VSNARRGQEWQCQCGYPLGRVYRDELTIELDNVSMAQTKQGAIVIQCARCGKLKSWFTRPEVAFLSAIRAMQRFSNNELLSQIMVILDERERKQKDERTGE